MNLNPFNLFKSNKANSPSQQDFRSDSIYSHDKGIGTSIDSVAMLQPTQFHFSSPEKNLRWWKAVSILRKVCGCVGEDAVMNGWRIKTNLDRLDSNSEELKQKASHVSRLIQNRLTELNMDSLITEAIRSMRLYSRGCLVYYVVEGKIVQSTNLLSKSMDLTSLNEIKAINILPEGKFFIEYTTQNALSANYNVPIISIETQKIHPSRYLWLVKDYSRELQTGSSVLDDCIQAAKANEIALWSTSSMLFDMATKIFKSPSVGNDLKTKELQDFLLRLRLSASTQSYLALNNNESLEKKTYEVRGMKEVLDFIIDQLALNSEIPQARLKGAAHGVLASGSYDMMNYYQYVERYRKKEVTKILDRTVNLVLNEKSKEVYKFLGETAKYLDWEVEYNPLWILAPSDQAEIDLKNSQRDKTDIESGKIIPSEARQLDKRFNELEIFDGGEDNGK